MKTEFVSLVSHELRTPLTSIKGFTDLILDGDAGDVNYEAREYLGIIKRNADRLVALIDDLLDISRIESGSIKLNLEPVSMQEVIAEVVASLRPQIEQKSQTLIVEADPTLPPVRGERDRLVQVVTNLVSNAYKYTLAGGSIRIQAQRQDDFARINVTDTGIGIAAEDQKNLFTRFYRVDNSLTREGGGTGLGLSIVKSVVELNGGTVNLVSELGKGSTFTVTVPLAQPAVDIATPAPTPAQAPAAAPGHRFILVVEEDPNIAELIRRYLERGGYSVDTASSSEEALQRVGQRRPDLITLDINLPGMDGLTVASRLAEAPETRRIPILVISVMQDKVRGAHLGLFNSLAKPINEEQLVGTVQRLLGQSRDRRVLVADDDADVRTLLRVALGKAGFAVKTARDGKEALAIARRGGIGLLLMDLRMPVMDGFAVLQALRKDQATAELPVIVMTGSERLKVGARASVLALGAADFVTKPFDLDTLIQEVRTIMQQGEER
jgi:CheY-like chemotaxis protein/two-component sensor histidine kinase